MRAPLIAKSKSVFVYSFRARCSSWASRPHFQHLVGRKTIIRTQNAVPNASEEAPESNSSPAPSNHSMIYRGSRRICFHHLGSSSSCDGRPINRNIAVAGDEVLFMELDSFPCGEPIFEER